MSQQDTAREVLPVAFFGDAGDARGVDKDFRPLPESAKVTASDPQPEPEPDADERPDGTPPPATDEPPVERTQTSVHDAQQAAAAAHQQRRAPYTFDGDPAPDDDLPWTTSGVPTADIQPTSISSTEGESKGHEAHDADQE